MQASLHADRQHDKKVILEALSKEVLGTHKGLKGPELDLWIGDHFESTFAETQEDGEEAEVLRMNLGLVHDDGVHLLRGGVALHLDRQDLSSRSHHLQVHQRTAPLKFNDVTNLSLEEKFVG